MLAGALLLGRATPGFLLNTFACRNTLCNVGMLPSYRFGCNAVPLASRGYGPALSSKVSNDLRTVVHRGRRGVSLVINAGNRFPLSVSRYRPTIESGGAVSVQGPSSHS